MTTIGVISDTHINSGGKRQLPPQVFEAFEGVDLILHAGDLNTLQVITDLEAMAPVIAVHGNNDDPEVMQRLPATRQLQIEECQIGLAHGDAGHVDFAKSLPGIYGSGQAAGNALSWFESIDCLVFGHSHWPLIKWWPLRRNENNEDEESDERHVLLFNPGSATKKRRAPEHSCGLLRVDGTNLDARLIAW